MKIRTLLALGLLLIIQLSQAQTFEYPWAFNSEQSGDFVIPRDIDVDANGNSYVLFNFSEPLQIGTIQFDPVGQTDIGVVKISPEGVTLWGAAAASTTADQGNAITVNSAGEVFITGYYTSDIQFDDLVILEANGSNGATEFFVAKINPDGLWAWAKQQSGTAIAAGNAIATDLQGNVIVGGSFFGQDLLIDQETFTAQEQLPFVFKANTDGEIIWSFHPETPYGASLGGLTVDDAGKVYLCGSFGTFEDAEVVLTAGSVTLTNIGDPEESITAADMYVLALSSDGTPIWGKNAGSLYFESFASSVAVDNNGQVYVTGVFKIQSQIQRLQLMLGPEGDYDYYLASFSSTGEWLWINQIGNPDFNTGSVVLKASSEGYIYLSGNLEPAPFDFGTFSLQSTGVNNSFLNRINTDGSYRWGFAHPSIFGFSVYANNSFRITGNFTDPITLGQTTLNATGGVNADMYTCRLNYTPLVPDGYIDADLNELTAFPNPFADQIKFEANDPILEVKLYDLTGRQIPCNSIYFENSVIVSTINSVSLGLVLAEIRTNFGVKTLRLTQVR